MMLRFKGRLMATIAIKSTTIAMATMVNSFWRLDYRIMRYCYLIN